MDGMVRGVGLRRDAGGDGVVGNRRRRWSAAQRAMIVAESCVAGAKVSEVAARHGVQASLLSAWRRQAMGRELAGGACGRRREMAPVGTTIGFVPVEVRAGAGRQIDAVSDSRSATGMIEIMLADASIRVSPGFDAATLSRVLTAVRRGVR
jgi:transposase